MLTNYINIFLNGGCEVSCNLKPFLANLELSWQMCILYWAVRECYVRTQLRCVALFDSHLDPQTYCGCFFHFFQYLCLLYVRFFKVLQASLFSLVSGLAGKALSLIICSSHLLDFRAKRPTPFCILSSQLCNRPPLNSLHSETRLHL